MSSLFIRLYLDEDVNVLIADLLKAKGFDVLTVRGAGQLQASDDDQLAYAINQQRTLVTHNRSDFEELIQNYFDTEKALWCNFGCPPFAPRSYTTLTGNLEPNHGR